MLAVREKSAWNSFKNDKWAARAHMISGKVHFVAPTAVQVAGYTVASAQSWARENHALVYDTLNLAYAACVDGRGDAIVLLPGTHTPTASITASKTGVTIFGSQAWAGLAARRPNSIIVAPAGDEAFNITGEDMAFEGVTCRPVTTKSFADYTAAANGLTIRNCFIDLFTPVVNIATAGFTGTAAILDFMFENNVSWSDGAQGPAVALAGACLRGRFMKNLYHVDTGTWASAVNLSAIDGITVEEDEATCGGTAMTACFTAADTTVIAGAFFRDCRKGVLVTKFIDGFETTSHAEIVGNHTATIGGGTGETLITVIT